MEITIIIACYNKQNFVAEAIDSVLSQSSGNWRLIIVDDCSTDGSLAIIKSKIVNDRIKLVCNSENKGANYSRNIGIFEAATDFVMFLDADDVLHRECVSTRLKIAEAFSKIDMFVFTMGVFNIKVGDTNFQWLPEVDDPLKKLLSHDLSWSVVQPLWRRQFLIKLRGFDTNFKRLQDVELNTRAVLEANGKIRMINAKPDCFYRIHPSRLNYDLFEFISRRVDSSVQYFNKFAPKLRPKYRKFLPLTLLETYFQMLYYLRNRQISYDEFSGLENKLLENGFVKEFLAWKVIYFRIAYFVNKKHRIPGFNFFIRTLMTI